MCWEEAVHWNIVVLIPVDLLHSVSVVAQKMLRDAYMHKTSVVGPITSGVREL